MSGDGGRLRFIPRHEDRDKYRQGYKADTPPGARPRLYPSELDFQTSVEVAKLAGWRVAHFRSARRADGSWRVPTTYDAHGWPDLTLVRPPRLIFAELKSHTGKPTERQLEWLDVLRLVPSVEVYLWNPDDWHSLVEVLTGREAA